MAPVRDTVIKSRNSLMLMGGFIKDMESIGA